MDNASLILSTLDTHCSHPVRLVLAELREAFERAKPRVREMVRQAG